MLGEIIKHVHVHDTSREFCRKSFSRFFAVGLFRTEVLGGLVIAVNRVNQYFAIRHTLRYRTQHVHSTCLSSNRIFPYFVTADGFVSTILLP